MKRSLLYRMVMLLCPVMMAQKVTVSGLIMDGTNNEALLAATVVLLQPKDSAQAAGVLTDADRVLSVTTGEAEVQMMLLLGTPDGATMRLKQIVEADEYGKLQPHDSGGS